MKNRICSAAVGVVMAVSLVAVASPAHAEDRRPCVSKVEFHDLGMHDTRAQIEHRWDVVGLGRVQDMDLIIYSGPVVTYPRCGFGPKQAWYGATYNKNGEYTLAVSWKRPGAHSHGHK